MSDNNVPDLTPQILIQIRDELRRHSEQFVAIKDDINRRFDEVRSEIGAVKQTVNERFDNLILAAGAGRGDHERRIARLERRLDGLEKKPKAK